MGIFSPITSIYNAVTGAADTTKAVYGVATHKDGVVGGLLNYFAQGNDGSIMGGIQDYFTGRDKLGFSGSMSLLGPLLGAAYSFATGSPGFMAMVVGFVAANLVGMVVNVLGSKLAHGSQDVEAPAQTPSLQPAVEKQMAKAHTVEVARPLSTPQVDSKTVNQPQIG